MIEIKNLTKSYGTKKAVDDISFTVNSGEILGFLGPNGAGKTTTMNIITGYNGATSGTVTIDGMDTVEQPMECRSRIGYLPEQPPLYMDMTVSEYLNFVFELKAPKVNRAAHLEEIMETVKISDVKGRLIKNLSKGYKQRVGIAQALIGNPDILILDEPTVGLDPKQIIEIRNVIKELGKNRTVILSSHILPEVSAICERVIIINKGKIMAIDTPENLSRTHSRDNRIMIRVEGSSTAIEKALHDVEGITYLEALGEKEPGTFDYIIESDDDTDIRRKLFAALAAAELPILMSKTMGLSLEEVFLQLTTDEATDADGEDLTEEGGEITEDAEESEEIEEIEETEESEVTEETEETEEAAKEDEDIESDI